MKINWIIYCLVGALILIGGEAYTQCNADAGNDTVVDCNNPSVVLNGSGGVLYSWSPANGLDDPNIANPTASPNNTTTYTLTVTGGNGCTQTSDVTVTVDDATPTADAGNDATTDCLNQPSVTLNTSGGVGYLWSPATGLDDPTSATPVANPNVTTTYTVTVSGANGCTDTDDVTITVNKDLPAVNAGNDTVIDCNVTAITLNGSGAGTYSWSPIIGLSDPNISNPVATPSSTTIYTLSVTGANGCVATDALTLTVDNQPPSVSAGADVTIDCNTPSTTLNAQGGNSYVWSPSTGLNDASIAAPNAMPAVTTTYTVEVTASNGCNANDQVIVTVDKDPPPANAGPDFGTTCASLNAQLSASGGIAYSWSPTTALSNPNIANPLAAPPTTTTYTVTVTGANGCTATDNTIVTLNDITPTSNAGIDQELCGVYSTVLAPDVSNNLNTDYFTWGADPLNPTAVTFSNLNDPNATLGNLQEGIYTIYWTVSNNVCPPVQDTLLVKVYDPPIANAGVDDSVCAANNVNLTASPAIGLSEGEWSLQNDFPNPNPTAVVFADSSINTTNVSGLVEGVYHFIWTVSNGNCIADKDTVEISVFNQPTSNAGEDIHLCHLYTADLDAVPTVGTAQGFWYLDPVFMNPGAVVFADSSLPSSNLSGLQEGVYQVIWEAYNGNCPVARDSVQIHVYDQPVSNAGAALSVCGVDSLNTDTLLFLNADFPVGTSTGVWSLDANFSNPSQAIFIDSTSPISSMTNLLEGVYQFVWTVANGTCVDATDIIQVTAYDSPYANGGINQDLCGQYEVEMTAFSPIGTSTGLWSPDLNFNNPSLISFDNPTNPNSNSTGYIEGEYQLIWTVSNSNCAPKDDTIRIVIYDPPIADAGSDIEVCDTSVVAFQAVDPIGWASGVWSEDTNFGNLTDIILLDDTLNTTQGSGYVEGTYQFVWTVTNGVCADDKDTMQVIMYNMPVSVAGEDQYLCDVDTIQFSGGGDVGTAIGYWMIDSMYTYSSVPSFRDSSNANTMADDFIVGDYPLIFVVENGVCPISYDTVLIVNKPKPVAGWEFPTEVCDNKCFDLISLSTAPTGETITVEWELGDAFYQDSNSLACLYETGEEDIKLVVTASNGCQDSLEAIDTIRVNPSPTANFDLSFYADSLLELQRLDVTNLASQDVLSFQYAMGNGDTLYDEDFIYFYETYGLYEITQWVENQYGCRDSISHGQQVGKRRAIYVPNSFTPNGDGVNDYFGPISRDLSPDFYEFTISNRLGKVFYSSNTIDEKWDGRIDGKLVQDGTFIWSLTYLFEGEIEVRTKEGHVVILK
ncbi:MAG: gliding motility-associated C-terminal domain-containing protein [Flavobacteriales bacterium]|jgi:gliding motility-associated-like protein|nr:gliding motility-associated C-terminal domain-containing protein [Flavobacteriales bacterium]